MVKHDSPSPDKVSPELEFESAAEQFLARAAFLPRLMDSSSELRISACDSAKEAAGRFPIEEVKAAAMRPLVITACLTANNGVRNAALEALTAILPDAAEPLREFGVGMAAPGRTNGLRAGETLIAARESLVALLRRYPLSSGLTEMIDYSVKIGRSPELNRDEGVAIPIVHASNTERPKAVRRNPRAESGAGELPFTDPTIGDLEFKDRSMPKPEPPVFVDAEREQKLARLVVTGNFDSRMDAIRELSHIRSAGAMQSVRVLAGGIDDMSSLERRQYLANLSGEQIALLVQAAKKALRGPVD